MASGPLGFFTTICGAEAADFDGFTDPIAYQQLPHDGAH